MYRASDRNLEVDVALKVLKPVFAYDEVFQRNFRREAHRAARFRHPNIVAIHYAGKTDDLVFFSMDLLEVGLSELLSATAPLEDRAVLKVGRDVSAALEFAHTHQGGVIHRDLKPDNIRFDRHGNAVVTDFGIAEAATSYTQATGTTVFTGTPRYISPEQARGHRVDARSDIYSLGVTLYELAVGDTPFQGRDWFELGRKHIQDEPEPPRSHNPDLDEALETMILRCLEKDPNQRYQSAAEVRREIEEIAGGAPPTVRLPDRLAPSRARDGSSTAAVGPEDPHHHRNPRTVGARVRDSLPEAFQTLERRLPSAAGRLGAVAVILAFAVAVGYAANVGGIADRYTPPSFLAFLPFVSADVHYVGMAMDRVEGQRDVGGEVALRFSGRVRARTATSAAVVLVGPGGERVPVRVRAAASRREVRIVPEDSLAYSAQYAVRITPELESAGGEPVTDEAHVVATFRTPPAPADGEPPRVVASRPAHGAREVDPAAAPQIRFSEPLDMATVTPSSARLVAAASGEPVPVGQTWEAARHTLRLSPRQELEPGSRYAVILGPGVTDRAGNSLPPDTVAFRTREARQTPETRAARPTGPGVLVVQPRPRSRWERLTVLVDGRNRGAPPVVVADLSPDTRHSVEIRGVSGASNYHVTLYRTPRRVPPGDTTFVTPEVPPFGEITVNSTPGGVVYLDGDYLGETPLARRPVRAGAHVLEIRPTPADSAEYYSYEDPFTLEDGGFEPFNVALPRETVGGGG